jgi:predicted MFS family arabinose efflux permease
MERTTKQPFRLSRAWLTVMLLFFVGALNYLDRTMIATMRESIVGSIPMTDAQFGLLTSVFLWVYGLLSPFAGFITDRFRKSYVIIGSLFVWSGVTWLTGHARTFEELLATRALMGISEAFYIPAALSLIIDYHKGPTQSLATGVHIAGTMVGQSLGFIGGWIAEKFAWNKAFSIFGVIGIIYSVFLIFLLKEAPADHVSDEEEPVSIKENNKNIRFTDAIKALFSKPAFIYLLFFWCVMGIIGWMVMGWLPTYYKEQFNLSQSVAGLYATAYLYPFSIVGLLIGGAIADRWSKTNKYARILTPIIGLAIAAPCIFLASYTDMLVIAIIFFMIYALTRMFVDSNLMPALCMVIDGRYRATGYGLMNMMATIVGGIGIFVAGALRDSQINLGIMYQFASLSIVICIILLFLVKRSAQKNLK